MFGVSMDEQQSAYTALVPDARVLVLKVSLYLPFRLKIVVCTHFAYVVESLKIDIKGLLNTELGIAPQALRLLGRYFDFVLLVYNFNETIKYKTAIAFSYP